MNENLKLAFPPMEGEFSYNDRHFIMSFAGKIIPEGKAMGDFVNTPEIENHLLYLRAAMIIYLEGWPENAGDYIRLKVGVNKSAHKHLSFVTEKESKELLASGMQLDTDDERTGWFAAYLGYLLYTWVDPRDLYKILIYSQALFAPRALMSMPNDSERWELLKSKATFSVFGQYLFNIDQQYPLAKELLKRFQFYGGNSEFYASFQFYHFLPPITTYQLVSEYLTKDDKDSLHIGALLISAYVPLENIQACVKALR